MEGAMVRTFAASAPGSGGAGRGATAATGRVLPTRRTKFSFIAFLTGETYFRERGSVKPP
ncbi:hypothetical protein GCM10022245_56420 [Streptomyces mayteni]